MEKNVLSGDRGVGSRIQQDLGLAADLDKALTLVFKGANVFEIHGPIPAGAPSLQKVRFSICRLAIQASVVTCDRIW